MINKEKMKEKKVVRVMVQRNIEKIKEKLIIISFRQG